MAMGHRDDEQETLFVTHANLRMSGGHPFYEAVEKVLRARGFDGFVEGLCEQFYKTGGRPSIPPGVYFRCLFVGLFEGIDSERGIAWRVAQAGRSVVCVDGAAAGRGASWAAAGMRLMLGGMPGDPAIAAMLKDFRSRD